ncbi:MAG TPA: hypothetical protein VFQ35_20395, partial [Polyangiaceae bacterium]|nr:hypothetical protein [Polyangiaceae bacterium]
PILAVALTLAAAAHAASPSDIAAARKLAQEGIELYDARDYQRSLEQMQRAEALFDAPIHLLYIARAQQKLGHLVEASETYRKLVRFPVEAGASQTFKEAVESGQRELPQVEARIGAIRIEVEPTSPEGLALSVDGKPVPLAVAGVDRPTDPGRHVVRAEAKGFAPAEATVDLKDGEKRAVSLKLSPAGSAPANTINLVGASAESSPTPNIAPQSDRRVSFFIGLRLGGAIPAGTLYNVQGERVATSDYISGGGFAELQGGVRFERYFALKLYLEGLAFGAGSWLGNQDGESSVAGQGLGIGAMVGTKPGQWGGFGELGLGYRRFEVKREFGDGVTCSGAQALGLNGLAFRLGGGAHIPVHRMIQLTPFVAASFGQVVSVHNDCEEYADTDKFPASGSIGSGDRRGHQLFLIGIGGDLLLGL